VLFFCLLFRVSFSFGLSLVRIYSFLGQAWAGELAMSRLARTADGKPGENVHSHDLYRSHASMNKQKKKPSLSEQTSSHCKQTWRLQAGC